MSASGRCCRVCQNPVNSGTTRQPPRTGWGLRLLLACVGLWFAALPVCAETDTQKLRDFRAEAEAFNRQDPFANAYRAGHYNGYLAGIIDALQGQRICFRDCVCEVDKLVERHLADHPAQQDTPVASWLLPLLERHYPCK